MTHYPRPLVVLCVAFGMALGMVTWALFIHDSGGAMSPGHVPQTQATPSR